MPTIDSENEKQIRQPMEVHISLMAGTGQNISLAMGSQYQYKLGIPRHLKYTDIQMRQLADLQGEGFLLDGSCVVYDSTVISEADTGKIGVRSNIGQPVAISISHTKTVESISMKLSGCEYAEYNGEEYSAETNILIIPFQATSGTIIFYPAEEDRRIEISDIVAGVVMYITQDSLVSCKAALRSDLSIIDPSLPSSDIEIVAYYPDDISEIVAGVTDDVPVTYYAGYPGSYSEERKFYLSEQIRWEEGQVTIRAEDEGSKLEKETFPIFIGHDWNGVYWVDSVDGAHWHLYRMIEDQLGMSGVHLVKKEDPPARTASGGVKPEKVASLIERQSQKDLIANMMNLLHQDYPEGYFEGIDSFWLTYVDAGRPSLTWMKPAAKWHIYEEDCGSVKKDVERTYQSITFPVKTVKSTGFVYVENGSSGTVFKNGGVALDFEDYTFMAQLYYDSGSYSFWQSDYDEMLSLPLGRSGSYNPGQASFEDVVYGKWLFDSGLADNRKLTDDEDFSNYIFAPWNSNPMQSASWNNLKRDGKISSETSLSLSAHGKSYVLSDDSLECTRSRQGISAEASQTTWDGVICAGKKGGGGSIEILPQYGMDSLLDRSGEKGSFEWKGDPRMQPRDVFVFHRLDGTEEECTIEQIDLEHAGGGTKATITYRKGIV